MPMTKIAVTIDERVAKEIDRLVAIGRYPSRSKVIQEALQEVLRGAKRYRLAVECAHLDPQEEIAMAEESLGADSWPEY